MSKYSRIVAALQETVWAILPAKLEALCAVVSDRILADALQASQRPEFQASRSVSIERVGATAVIPVMGTIAQRIGLLGAASGGVSTVQIGAQIDLAVADPQVDNILLHIDSPGGSVYGVQELGEKIRAARARKPIVALADSLAASAAYWLAAQASEVVVVPGGEVGSIGVIALHVDQSIYNENLGIKPTFVFAGKHKADGNPHEPLSDAALDDMQARVNERYTAFIAAVAAGRGVSASTVKTEFGEGRVVAALRAKELGMVDRVDTLEATLERLRSGDRRRLRGARAEILRAEIDLAQSFG